MRKIGLLGMFVTFSMVACGGSMGASKSPPSEPAMASAPRGTSGTSEESAPSAGYSAAATTPASPSTPSAAPKSEAKSASASASADATPAAGRAASPPPPAPPAPPPPPADAPIATAPKPEPAKRLPQSGQLTAGVWDDNRNFDFFKPYMSNFKNRNGQDFAMFSEQELTTSRDLTNAQQQGHNELDVQLVLDTTGSMGDELSYLQSEFDAIAAKIRVKFPQVTPRYSLVVYRDHGDEYLTRQFDFTSNTTTFRKDLRAQSAGGGGDTPEAVVEGLTSGLRQSWRVQNNVAKVMFWVADAPAHPGEGKVLANVIREAKKKGVHVYPIASSDADDAAEFQMRSAAQMTGGRYVFLTNDSGIGNNHAEPHIPCYNVTRLDGAIVRMIEVEMTGRHVEPESNEVVRSVGRPNKEGKCTLSSGMLVASF